MIATLNLPRLGETMETGRIAGWLKRPGDAFRRGETIVEIESDKTVVELPALADGTLVEVLAAEGTDVDVGAPLCRYQAAGDSDGAAEPTAELVAEAAPAPARPAEAEPMSRAAPPAPPRLATRPRATPIARRLARETGTELASLQGTGRRGRIEGDDVRRARPAPPAASAASAGLAVARWPAQGRQGGRALLLHGFGGDAQTWAAFAPQLARRGLAVSAPDLPGHGATAHDASDLADLAEPLAGLLAEGEPAELIGHSLGAAVAVTLARRYPQHVARLTLLAPAGVGAAINGDFLHGMAAVKTPGALSHLLRQLSPRPPALSKAQLDELAQSLAAGRLAELAAAIAGGNQQQVDIVADLEALPMPTRVVWGLADEIIPWTQVTRLPTRVAIHLVPGAGHMPHWDAPQQVAALFDDAA